jgi:hypothetical protein
MAPKNTMVFEYDDDDGNEISVSLPATFVVCPTCEGHGTHLREGIREHAYTREEFEESFDDEEREEYFRHGGRYDVTCEQCGGKRVVLEVDRDACVTAEQRSALAAYDAALEDDRQYRAECESERRMGC